MIRKLTASAFMIAMILIVALKTPVFAYCFCEEKILVDPCHCELEAQIFPRDFLGDVEFSSAHQDCDEMISISSGSFVSQNPITEQKAPNTLLAPHSLAPASLPSFSSTERLSLAPIRGSPPPPDLPIYLRTKNLRL